MVGDFDLLVGRRPAGFPLRVVGGAAHLHLLAEDVEELRLRRRHALGEGGCGAAGDEGQQGEAQKALSHGHAPLPEGGHECVGFAGDELRPGNGRQPEPERSRICDLGRLR